MAGVWARLAHTGGLIAIALAAGTGGTPWAAGTGGTAWAAGTGGPGAGATGPAPGSVAAAEAAAAGSAARVAQLTREYQQQTAAEQQAATELAAAFAVQAAVQQRSDQDQARLTEARIRQAAEIRAVYAGGGRLSLLMSVLGAQSPDDALWRAGMIQLVQGQLLDTAGQDAAVAAARAGASAARVQATQDADAQLAVAMRRLQDDTARADALLVQAKVELSRLSKRAGQLKAAQLAAQRLAAAQAAAQAAQLASQNVGALAIPAAYLVAYQQAARTCPGMDWTLLAAVGQVESGHGRNNGPSSAGAIGPMQFMPATFAQYAVDGDGDGVTSPWDYRDAIFTAARYLCVSGVDQGTPTGIQQALFTYNHAQWYVDLVLAAQRAIQSAYRPSTG